MLSKKYRLTKKEIELVAKKGKRISLSYMDIRYIGDESIENHEFAIAVSKRVDKRAVIRNMIKRKIRAALYDLVRKDNIKKGKYLFIVKDRALVNLKSLEIEQLVANHIASK